MKTYFALSQKTGLVKIGRSIDVDARIKHLSWEYDDVITLLLCIDGDYEMRVHKTLKSKRVKGEWFAVNLEDIKIALPIAKAMPVPMPRTDKINIAIEYDMHHRLQLLSALTGQNLRHIVTQACREYLEISDNKKKARKSR